MANLRPQILKFQDRAKELEAAGQDKAAHDMKMKMVELFRINNVSPLKAMVPMVIQMPLFISFFLALRSMATAPVSRVYLGWASSQISSASTRTVVVFFWGLAGGRQLQLRPVLHQIGRVHVNRWYALVHKLGSTRSILCAPSACQWISPSHRRGRFITLAFRESTVITGPIVVRVLHPLAWQ